MKFEDIHAALNLEVRAKQLIYLEGTAMRISEHERNKHLPSFSHEFLLDLPTGERKSFIFHKTHQE